MGGPGCGHWSGWQWVGVQPLLTSALTCQAGGPAPGPGHAVAAAARGHEEPAGVAEFQPRPAAYPLLVPGHGRPAPRGHMGWGGLPVAGPALRAHATCCLQFRTLKPEEQRQALRALELHYQAFLRDSQDASSFGPEDRLQAEREYSSCSRHYQQLLQSLEQGRCGECRRAWAGGQTAAHE